MLLYGMDILNNKASPCISKWRYKEFCCCNECRWTWKQVIHTQTTYYWFSNKWHDMEITCYVYDSYILLDFKNTTIMGLCIKHILQQYRAKSESTFPKILMTNMYWSMCKKTNCVSNIFCKKSTCGEGNLQIYTLA